MHFFFAFERDTGGGGGRQSLPFLATGIFRYGNSPKRSWGLQGLISIFNKFPRKIPTLSSAYTKAPYWIPVMMQKV